METRADESQIHPAGQIGLAGTPLDAHAAHTTGRRPSTATLVALAHAVDRDLTTPDHAPATVRANATTGSGPAMSNGFECG
jgi:hypothetical protein